MKKTFGELSIGDKIYYYSFSGQCKVKELVISSITDENEYGGRFYYFSDTTLYDRFLPGHESLIYDYHKYLEIYSTDNNLQRMFDNIFQCGIRYNQYQVKCSIGLSDF